MSDAEGEFLSVLKEFGKRYAEYHFCTERDIVWTIQTLLYERLSRDGQWLVFNDFPVIKGSKRSICCDLAIVPKGTGIPTERIALAVEFKFEPDHQRRYPDGDIWPTKLDPSVVSWKGGVMKDINRVRQFVEIGRVDVGYSVFVDEGAHFKYPKLPEGTTMREWRRSPNQSKAKVLMFRFSAESKNDSQPKKSGQIFI